MRLANLAIEGFHDLSLTRKTVRRHSKAAEQANEKAFRCEPTISWAAFAELEAEISHVQASAGPVAAYQARPHKNLIKLRSNSANCLKQVIFWVNSTRT
jgi:hypothetical protein